MKMKWICILMIVLAGSCIYKESKVVCVDVLDGDTFKLSNGETVRLSGIDAPESYQEGGDIARQFLASMVLNEDITLVTSSDQRDTYGRILGLIYVNETCVNEEMIRNGYAEARYLSEGDPRCGVHIQLEIEAEKTRAGLWKTGIFQSRIDVQWNEQTPLIQWQDSNHYVGQVVIVEGKIVDIQYSDKACFLYFDSTGGKSFFAVIFACDLSSFPLHPDILWIGRNVRINGLIREYQGRPEIIIKSPQQIRNVG
ncbi:MAG: thermonuclease family protein [Theionarchaea archaeon]|nr:thermonuclease family protein [Theionarchaea archaeon]